MSSKPIGIFDSGVGGLTVMRAVQKLLPSESIIYLGDTARVPYGNRSADTILRYTEECAIFLAGKGVKAIVIACNTASAHALPYLEHRFHFPLLGVIEPGVAKSLEVSKRKKIGVIGTHATVGSEVYTKALRKKEPQVEVTSLASPLFVPLVEEGWLHHEVTELIAREYLNPLLQTEIDALILGCTHYPLLKSVLSKVVGDKITLVDSAEAVAASLKNLLVQQSLLSESSEGGETNIYVTDMPGQFEKTAKLFLGNTLPTVRRVRLI